MLSVVTVFSAVVLCCLTWSATATGCQEPPISKTHKQYLEAQMIEDKVSLPKISFKEDLVQNANQSEECPKNVAVMKLRHRLSGRAQCTSVAKSYGTSFNSQPTYPRNNTNKELCVPSGCSLYINNQVYRGECQRSLRQKIILQRTDQCETIGDSQFYIYQAVAIYETTEFVCAFLKPTTQAPIESEYTYSYYR